MATMNRTRILVISIMILGLLLVSGCTGRDAREGNENLNESQLRDYFEFEYLGLDNSTTYYLSPNESMKTVIYVTDVTSINVTSQSDMMSNSPLIGEVFAMTSQGRLVNVTNSTSKAYGQYRINLRFDDNFTGFVVYTETNVGKQNFVHGLMDDGFVRVVLPAGYSTGHPIIGAVRPFGSDIGVIKGSADNSAGASVGSDSTTADRVVVAWENPYSTSKTVIVNYYPENASTIMGIAGLLIAFFAMGVIVWYRISMKRLKDRQDEKV